MKKIILPTDFSENAYNAIRYAVQLFNDVQTTFYLLHTYTPAIYQTEYVLQSPGQIGLGDSYQESSQSRLEELKTKLEEEFDDPAHIFIPHSALNFLVDEVIQTVKNEKADLVIMGTQGATGAKELLLGTQTVHVIKKATCPVIAVPSGHEYENPTKILFPTDYEIDYQKEQLQQLLNIAISHSGDIEIIHVSSGFDLTQNQLKNKQKLKDVLNGIAHLFHDLPSQEIITAINGFQVKKRTNLLVMVQNRHTFLERLFIEPTIKKIGFHITFPFMVIPHLDK
ncbi:MULTISPECIES: universal stress protein [Flagellimonas]|uniref:Universal stress protein n=2 Tax=Flagellimonas TaxID=444459 RepID=A0A3A1NHC6_9FLAO|nr:MULTISPECIES: universal stress protein [Allomuricauda]MBW8242789.1 universal stress protein [Allomuricauda oceani]QII45476.1 universal stress protein [Allomuricauda oceani]RIV42424.1 universal stress protein [Allomuricauda maritima]TXJ91454.1 universal stress protein [Allomuricauda maritima]